MRKRESMVKTIALTLIVFVFSIAFTACDKTSGGTQKDVFGNTNGNIANVGIAAKQGDWVYYSNTNSNAGESADTTLYKMKTDDSERQSLYDAKNGAFSINVVGDWIYFNELYGDSKNNIYKIKTDGTNLQLLESIDYGRDISLIVVNDWIYLSNGYRMKTDGSNKQKLYDKTVSDPADINIVDEWIYFCDKDEAGNSAVFKVKTDGSDLKKVFSGEAENMIVDGDWIFYLQPENEYPGIEDLYRIKVEGSENQQIGKNVSDINVSGDWIYYQTINSNDISLNKMKTDGSDNQSLCTGNIRDVNIIDDWIYYHVGETNDNSFYRIKTDGTAQQIIPPK